MDLLFDMATFQALAKMRSHVDHTVQLLDDMTTSLGASFRRFQEDVCPNHKTRELPKEQRAREARAAKAQASTSTDTQKRPHQPKKEPGEREFSLNTPKFHFAGDYVWYIKNYGSLDCYSTGKVSHHSPLRLQLTLWPG